MVCRSSPVHWKQRDRGANGAVGLPTTEEVTMWPEGRETRQCVLAELDRQIAILTEMAERGTRLLHRLDAFAAKIDAKDIEVQALRSRLERYLAMTVTRKRARALLSQRLSDILAGEAKLDDCQRMLTERKQELLARARELNRPLTGGH